ncbi:MAG TPA: IS4 family transposase [Methylobacter sp.]|jgi:hypothetical protein
MHAQHIMQDFLNQNCEFVHAKRRATLTAVADTVSRGCLSIMGLSKVLGGYVGVRHHIKRRDRLLGNRKLAGERSAIYGATIQRVLQQNERPLIIVDWSDLRADRSWQVLRAALIVLRRAVTLYEEVHPIAVAGSLPVHEVFLKRLPSLLPTQCRPILVTDAGFRSTWFALLNSMGYSWIGRIRNRDMILPQTPYGQWCGCKVLYVLAKPYAQDFGAFHFVRQHPVPCRLVLIRMRSANRQHRTVHGKRTRSAHSLKQSKSNREPWLLATSTDLADHTTDAVVAIYARRMQIEQPFRDTKDEHWRLGLAHSQSRRRDRLESLLLIGALACYALWITGITAKYAGYRVEYGSKRKAVSALSILSLARWRVDEFPDIQIRHHLLLILSIYWHQ